MLALLSSKLFPTLVVLQWFTSHLPNPVAIAITAIVDAMDSFIPRLSNLMEGFGLWLLALICFSKIKM